MCDIMHTVAVNKKLTFRSVSTIVLPFYAIVFAPFVRTRICAFIVFTFACTRLIGRRDHRYYTLVPGLETRAPLHMFTVEE